MFMPLRLYNEIPYTEYNNLCYSHPLHLRIDLLVSLTNENFIDLRWKKDSERLEILDNNYKINRPKNFNNNSVYKKSNYYLNIIIEKFLKNRDDYVYYGDVAYYLYIERSMLKDYFKPHIKYFEIGMKNPSNIFKELKRICKNKITIKKYCPFLKYVPTRYIVCDSKNQNTIILIIYDLSDRTVPYIEYKGCKFLSFQCLLLNYYFMSYLSIIYNIKNKKDIAESCIYELERAKKYYFTKNNIDENYDSIFKSYVKKFIGNNKDLYLESKIKNWGNRNKFRYIPKKREHLIEVENIGSGKIKNISGEFNKYI